MQKLIGLAMSDLAEALRGDTVAQRLGSPRGEAAGPGGSVPPKGRRREPGRALPVRAGSWLGSVAKGKQLSRCSLLQRLLQKDPGRARGDFQSTEGYYSLWQTHQYF